MDEIELAPLFETIGGCKRVLRLCATSKRMKDWCDENVTLFAKHMSRHRAFRSFFEGVHTMSQYRKACDNTIKLITFRNNLELLLRLVDTMRRRDNIKVLLLAIEYAPTSTRTGARIELTTIDPDKECLLLKSSNQSNNVKLEPGTGVRASVSLSKTKVQNMSAASQMHKVAQHLHGIDLSRTSLPKTENLKSQIRLLGQSGQKYCALRMNVWTNDTFGTDVDVDDIRDLWN